MKTTENALSCHSFGERILASTVSHSATMATEMDLSKLQASQASISKSGNLDNDQG